jgi:glycosyltransferase involved in cell wall biosynthesis
MYLSIVMPVYNEEQNVHLVYEATLKAVSPLTK